MSSPFIIVALNVNTFLRIIFSLQVGRLRTFRTTPPPRHRHAASIVSGYLGIIDYFQKRAIAASLHGTCDFCNELLSTSKTF